MLVRPQGGNPVGGAHLHHSGNLSMGGALLEFGDWYAYHTALSSNPHTLTQLICGENLATTTMKMTHQQHMPPPTAEYDGGGLMPLLEVGKHHSFGHLQSTQGHQVHQHLICVWWVGWQHFSWSIMHCLH